MTWIWYDHNIIIIPWLWWSYPLWDQLGNFAASCWQYFQDGWLLSIAMKLVRPSGNWQTCGDRILSDQQKYNLFDIFEICCYQYFQDDWLLLIADVWNLTDRWSFVIKRKFLHCIKIQDPAVFQEDVPARDHHLVDQLWSDSTTAFCELLCLSGNETRSAPPFPP